MIRLKLLANAPRHDAVVGSSLCAACPHASAGCCVGPPPLDWSDLGRIVLAGGDAWLVAEVVAGRLRARAGGLEVRRTKAVARPGGPRVSKCVYHGMEGCTIAPTRRAATCNYYLCESAFEREPSPVVRSRARELQQGLAAELSRWDERLAAEVHEAWPDGPTYDAPFFAWLGGRFAALRDEAPSGLPAGASDAAPDACRKQG